MSQENSYPKYPIGYVVTVFFYGDKTKYEYVGRGEWKFLSGKNTSGAYSALIDLITNE